MKLISLRKAQRDYPSAWGAIQAQIVQLKEPNDADVIALSARVIEIEGSEMLEVICLCDLVEEGDLDTPATAIRIQARINDPLQPQQLH